MITLLKLVEFCLNYFKKFPCVIHESANFIIVDKPPDLRINSNQKYHYTIQTFLREKFPKYVNEKLSHDFYFVHRLDYSTSGVLCVPLTKLACRESSKKFQLRQTKKYYMAIVRGILSQHFVAVTQGIGEVVNGGDVQKMCTADSRDCVKPRNAMTLLLALEFGFYENYPGTKVLIRPITGRRHQIRVHCSHLGHTIVGDYTYSNKRDINPNRMFLHSLRLVLPTDMENIDVETEDPFEVENYKNWISTTICNSLSEGYNVLDRMADNFLQTNI